MCQLGPQGPVSMSKPAALLGLNTSPEGDDLCGGFFGGCWSMLMLHPSPFSLAGGSSLGLWGMSWGVQSQHSGAGGEG